MTNGLSLIKKIFKHLPQALRGDTEEYTSGSISKAIFMLSIPMVLEMLMESIFVLVDAYYVSSLGADAIATVGLTESVLTLVYAISIGLCMGITAIVARRIGEKDPRGASRAAVHAIYLGILLAIAIAYVGIRYPKEILRFMGGSPELVETGYGFTQILLGGNVTIVLLFLINAVFRGAGHAVIAMRVLLLSNALNLILDPILIFGWGPVPAYGVKGAAIATTIGRGTAVLSQLIVLFFGSGLIRIYFNDLRLRLTMLWNLIRVSLGGIGQFIIGTSSWVFLMRIMAEFGSEALAGYTIAIRVLMFTMMPSWGMSNAAATLVGQNLGAKQPGRAEASTWLTSKYNAVFMFFVSVVYLLFAQPILSVFSSEPEVIRFGKLALQIIAAGYVFYAFGMVVIQAFNGAGDTRTPTIMNFFCFWMFQLPLAYVLAVILDWGPIGVFLAVTLAEVVLSIIAVRYFVRGRWKTVKV